MDSKSDQENASDAELPGPGSSVTDLSVSQGTTADDLDRNKDTNKDTVRISVPLGVRGTLCALCLRKRKNISCLSFKDLTDHLSKHHVCANILWVCKQCNKSFPKSHGWRCHFVKCKGAHDPQISRGSFNCEVCSESFGTKIGLSMHERHMHPALRNRKRMEQAERPRKPRGKKASVWSPEEVDLLKKLDARFRNARFPNVEIQKHIPSKTTEQIRSKRKDLPKLVRQEISSASSSDDEVQILEIVNLQTNQDVNISIGEATNATDVMHGIEDEYTWLNEMKVAIESNAIVPNTIRVMYNRLMSIWENGYSDLNKLSADIEYFITTDLIPFLSRTDNDDADNLQSKSKRKTTKGGNKKRRNAKRKYEFARSQEMYKQCPKKLASMILKGDISMINPPHPLPEEADISQLYNELWGIEGPLNVKQIEPDAAFVELKRALPPVKVDEVDRKIKKTKLKSAAGPDGIQKSALNKQGIPILLCKLYNILLYANYYPKCWKVNRTTLIPKEGKDLKDVKNWRPITIGSLISRIYSSLIDRRLRAVIDEHVRQKGFTSENGCKQNVVLLAEAIQRCKANTGGVFSILDISKAFDTIPHSAIGLALQRKGIPSRVCKYVREMYIDCSTVIRTNGPRNVSVCIRRGVKQGDPLSPLLFNLCIEKLIEDIESGTSGLAVSNDRNISILAFADDLVLLSGNRLETREQLRLTSAFLSGLGMSLSAGKCGTFQIKTTKDTWYISDPDVSIGEEKVPHIDSDEMFSYLGARFGPWKGLHKGQVVPDIIGTMKRIRTLALKPFQKVDLFITYVLPHFIYSLLISPPSESTLKLLDTEIRQQIKEMLHLVSSTARGFFYTPKSDGGLGIPRLEHVVKLATLRNGIKMMSSNDPAVREVLQHDNTERRLKQIANSLRINWPATLEDITKARNRLKAEEAKRWSELRSQGHGVQDYHNDKIGNYWLHNPSILKSSRYIDALRLRTNTYGTKVVLARANKEIDIKCRKCHSQPETIGHILGLCVHTKQLRIKRHDEVKNFIASKLASSKEVAVEPTLRVGGGLFKPDLIIKSGNEAFIVDVTVRYEHRDYLQKASKEKIDKYTCCIEQVKQRMGCQTCKILPIVVGSRGVMPQSTAQNLTTLGIKKSDKLTIALNVLRSSIEISNIFIDYDT